MTTTTLELTASDGTPLFVRDTSPPEVEGTVFITHGHGEHSARYGHVTGALCGANFRVIAHDLRGHGRSGGRRGDAPSFPTFLEDIDLILRERAPQAPLFLYGHSLGGLITLRYTQTRADAVAGTVAASPWIRLAFEPPRWKLALGRMALRLYPGWRQFTGNNVGRLSRDPAFLATLPDLHLSHHQISARLFFGILEACAQAQAHADEMRTPLLLLHGQRDPVTSWQATRDFFEAARSEEKRLQLYPDTLHETHNDLNREAVMADVIGWLCQQREAWHLA